MFSHIIKSLNVLAVNQQSTGKKKDSDEGILFNGRKMFLSC